MPKFKYYIVDDGGSVTGTDDEAQAKLWVGVSGIVGVINADEGTELISGEEIDIDRADVLAELSDPEDEPE